MELLTSILENFSPISARPAGARLLYIYGRYDTTAMKIAVMYIIRKL
jgi:hypothetical protein